MKWAISNPVEIEQYPWSDQIKYPYAGSFKNEKNNDSDKSGHSSSRWIIMLEKWAKK